MISVPVYALHMYTLLHLAVLAVTVLVLTRLLPSVRVRSTGAAVGVAVVYSLLNFFLGWLLTFLVKTVLFVPGILSLGLLFLLVPFIVNAALLWMTDKLMESFEISSWKGLVVSAAAITVVSGLRYLPGLHGTWHW